MILIEIGVFSGNFLVLRNLGRYPLSNFWLRRYRVTFLVSSEYFWTRKISGATPLEFFLAFLLFTQHVHGNFWTEFEKFSVPFKIYLRIDLCR